MDDFTTILTTLLPSIITGWVSYKGMAIKADKDSKNKEIKDEIRFAKLHAEMEKNRSLQDQRSTLIVEELRKDIERLEDKQEKYNNLQERVYKLEINSDCKKCN